MFRLLLFGILFIALSGRARAGDSFVLSDGLSRAPAVTLHCVSAAGLAVPCGTSATPLVVSPSAGAATAVNQQSQLFAEQNSALAIGTGSDAVYAGGSGTLVGLLKSLWATVNVGIPALPAGGSLLSRSLVMPAAQSVTFYPPNATRRYLAFQAPQTTGVWINLIGGVAAPNAVDCAYFGPGTFYESGSFVNRGPIAIYSPVSAVVSAWEG